MSGLHDLQAYEVVEGIKQGLFSAEEYVSSVIKTLEHVESRLHVLQNYWNLMFLHMMLQLFNA
jgi:hypothetical protein